MCATIDPSPASGWYVNENESVVLTHFAAAADLRERAGRIADGSLAEDRADVGEQPWRRREIVAGLAAIMAPVPFLRSAGWCRSRDNNSRAVAGRVIGVAVDILADGVELDEIWLLIDRSIR